MLLAACAGPLVPDWRSNAHDAMNNAMQAYLSGNETVADLEFARARNEIAATGRPDLLARAELMHCAARVASLDFDDCPAYLQLALDAQPPERAYAAFLSGQWQAIDATQLPAAQRGIVSAGASGAAASPQVLEGIADPLSRLVAAGVLLRRGELAPQGLELAARTASAQGWRRPLLAWLGLQSRRASALGQSDEAARIQRQIELAAGPARGLQAPAR
jgi:hypothetical protein